tara:strand:- start:2622 stop:3038 length:417 start_codon:yes stop_codon:yes gene_type:complete
MIEKYYSKVDKNLLLHLVFRLNDHTSNRRQPIAPTEEFLQLQVVKHDKGMVTKPHKHLWKNLPAKTITQESWVVIQGQVKFYMYDVDDILLETAILNPGDVSMTFRGAHTYEMLQDNTIVYEYKTGPYEGPANDKEWI